MNAEYAERITPLIDERNKGIKAGQPIKNILSDMFALKESQRRVRHMIKTATKAESRNRLKTMYNRSRCELWYQEDRIPVEREPYGK